MLLGSFAELMLWNRDTGAEVHEAKGARIEMFWSFMVVGRLEIPHGIFRQAMDVERRVVSLEVVFADACYGGQVREDD